MSKVKIYADRIAGKVKTLFDSIAAYATIPALADLDPEDLVCKFNLEEYVTPYTPVQFLMPAGMALPYVVGTDLTNALIVTTYLCLPDGVRDLSSQPVSIQGLPGQLSTDSVFTIQQITLDGHDDGNGNNLDDLWVVISKG